jgi:hypothetical protein
MKQKITEWLLFFLLVEGVLILTILLILAVIRMLMPEFNNDQR